MPSKEILKSSALLLRKRQTPSQIPRMNQHGNPGSVSGQETSIQTLLSSDYIEILKDALYQPPFPTLGYEWETGLVWGLAEQHIRTLGAFRLRSDGSITTAHAWARELNSPVYGKRHTPVDMMTEHIEQVLPMIDEINGTMGLHVHFGIPKLSMLYSPQFVTFVEKEYQNTFGKNKEDIVRVGNNYCRFYRNKKKLGKMYAQASKDFHDESRYASVNFNSYQRFGTVEFRMFSSPDSINGVLKRLAFIAAVFRAWKPTQSRKVFIQKVHV